MKSGIVSFDKGSRKNKKNKYFLNGGSAIKRGEGGKGLAIRKKILIFKTNKKVPTAIKLEGGRG